MTEISSIQLLCTGLIIVLFSIVFMIIQANWNFKAMQHKMNAEQDKPEEDILVPEKEIRLIPQKEIKLVPIMTIEEEPATVVPVTERPREIAFAKEEEAEEMFALGKAQ